MCYVYIETESWTDEKGVRHKEFTTGFYKPDGKFEADGDYDDREYAARRVNYLNGGIDQDYPTMVHLHEN